MPTATSRGKPPTAASAASRSPRNRRSGSNDADVRKLSVALRVIKSVPDHELVLDREADVLDLHVDFPARRLAQQAGGAQVRRRAGTQDVLEIGERQAGVHDVLDDHNVAAFDRRPQIL